jgi:eukaryotic-like serine/threonine-protein kinase
MTKQPDPSNSTAPERLAPGTEVGNYRIHELRREGGFAAVYRASRIENGEAVALKILHPHLVADGRAFDRLRREAETVSQLNHPYIVRVYECGDARVSGPYIAMEWVDGRNLADELRARGPLSLAETLGVMEELCSALGAAHERGIVHRDLKAENVIAVPRNGWFTIKLVDFGIAKLFDRGRGKSEGTATTHAGGTPLNMAPEQILGQAVDARTDVYALGILLHHLLTGALPFRGATAVETEELQLQAPVPRISDVTPVPPAVDTVLQRALDKSRVRRHASVHEFLAELRAAVESRETAAPEVPTIGVYVHARIAEHAAEREDDLLDDLDRILSTARTALAAVNLAPAVESADAILGTAALPPTASEALRFRHRVLHTAVSLSERLADRPAPLARVSITAHVATATTRIHRGRPVLGGDLVRVREWTAGLPVTDVVATAPMLAGLEHSFHTLLVRPGAWIVRTPK